MGESRLGRLELFVGSVFSGKTYALIRSLKEPFEQYPSPEQVMVFKSKRDTRYAEAAIVSHSQLKIPATPLDASAELYDHLHVSTRVIAIDEVQFFDDGLIAVCNNLLQRGIDILASGLDLDFRGEHFPFCRAGSDQFEISSLTMKNLIGMAQKTNKLPATCDQNTGYGRLCLRDAHFTQRLLHDQPAPYTDPLIVIGDEKERNGRAYRARCERHHIVPGHPRRHSMQEQD